MTVYVVGRNKATSEVRVSVDLQRTEDRTLGVPPEEEEPAKETGKDA